MAARFLPVAALTAVLGPMIGNGLSWAQITAGCTANSFTTPSWLVQDFTSQIAGDLTVAAFHALNRATNVTTELRCTSTTPTSGWQSCRSRNQTEQPLIASFQADTSTAWFLFNETWPCNDLTPSQPLTFSALGNSSVALNCTTDESKTTTCHSATPLLAKAALSSPVKITPSYVSGPPGHDTPGCTADSGTPAWEVVASQINLRKVSGLRQSGNAFVIIKNDHLGYTASCGGTLTAASGPQPLSCEGQIAYRRPDKYQIHTELSFDPDNLTLGINQTWFCDDQAQPSRKPQPPSPLPPPSIVPTHHSAPPPPPPSISITGSGTTPLPLECTVFNQTATETTTFCSGGTTDGPVRGNATARALLPPFSLNDPLPTAESCTISSLVAPAWWFNGFETNTTTAHSETVTARFGMELQTAGEASGNFAIVVVEGVEVGGGEANSSAELPWNRCVLESVGDVALAPTGCELRYDMASGFLGLRVNWTCADLDRGSPVLFGGEVRTLVPELTCVTSGTDIRCASPVVEPWRANVTSLTWK
ncbi:predicted protein [Chaetomium globosum CBS 148.51]|uniref:Ig-like domain-containing protein n=1 Tax=Chaetomium globosum (strain ATCC 6205 / CBS 148.51 / DSM 1962 / NBRC 6347 / NRRL 1970) TaxID=306901 RepID=Q2GZC9_CHAGB|nr:uncharacterized protein CHGG_05117 [Chaetomium globosum CBS 148.51]EAQ88498.1 predicted protein [Chaetomium globosum CBS 148.51]